MSIFRIRSQLTANLAMFRMAAGMFAMFFFNSIYFQRVLGYGPLKTGLAFLRRFGRRLGIRAVTAVGMLLGTASLVLLTQLPVHGSCVSDVLPSIVVSGVGMGAVFVPLTLIATIGLTEAEQGLASGLFYSRSRRQRAWSRRVVDDRCEQDVVPGRGAGARARGRFHWAYTTGAGIMFDSLVVMIALWRRRRVARIDEQAAAREGVVVGSHDATTARKLRSVRRNLSFLVLTYSRAHRVAGRRRGC